MPVYNYICQKCAQTFEIKASLEQKEAQLATLFLCPACQSQDIKQDFSHANIACPSTSNQSAGSCCSGGCCQH